MSESGFLVLETGEIYQGLFHGKTERAGEIVFNTSHSGYEEIATDPSYFSQIVLMTAPMQGNYGVDNKVWESRQIWIEGFISLQTQPSWIQRLNENQIPCLTELDTREIAMRLREEGTPWGALVKTDSKEQAFKKAKILIEEKKKTEKDWVYLTSRKQIEIRKGRKATGPRIAVLDLGAKENILREIESLTKEVIVFPSRTPAAEILAVHPDGILLTNGPGNPVDVKVAPETVQQLIGKKPIFGICMGHQILGLALGGKTYRLKFGHRGSNHPVRDEILGQIYMSSQNHGYAVEKKSLPSDIKITQTNLNDQSVAGFHSSIRKVLGIQFHPESHPGPHEASKLFNFFIDSMVGEK